MSRTNHHRHQRRQHQGEDFWSRRAGMGSCAYNTYNKKTTIRKERMESKEGLQTLLIDFNLYYTCTRAL